MKRNLLKYIATLTYVIIFFAICSIPVLTMPFFDFSLDTSSENRDKSELPDLMTEDGFNWTYFSEVDDYLSDNFQFREILVAINANYKDIIFNTSAEEQVILGKNNWLFYEETVDDYTGLDTLSDMEIQHIVKTISLIDEYAQSVDCEFAFTIAANKNSIYPEYMPWYYISYSDESNAEKVIAELEEQEMLDLYTNMFELFENTEEISYLQMDSHWNNYGAYLGFLEMCETLNIEEINFEIVSEEIRVDYESDLLGMLYATGEIYDEQIYYEFDTTYEYISNFKSVEDLQIQTACSTGEDSIIVFRDSFGNALIEYFARQFSEVEFSRVVPYSVYKAADTDYMILEIVERNIPNLLASAPIMPAIERSQTYISETTDVEIVAYAEEETNDFLHVFGTFVSDDADEVHEVYIEITTTEGTVYYEAFPIIEEDLELEDSSQASGFSAYLPIELSGNTFDIQIKYK